ncbi:MAG: lysylphosphatidylglycerol synthase transmembrane domain-containing protein [Candidatus Methylacidiphilales bacterium]
MVESKRAGRGINWGFWIRLAVVAAIFTWIGSKNDWVAFGRELANADLRWLLAAWLAFGLAQVAGAWRWKMLLQVQQIRLSYGRTWVINMIGFFFNQFLFGSTGGDLVKIFYAIRQAPHKKAEAALSMVMDRVIGLSAILAITFLLIPFEWRTLGANEDTRFIVRVLAVVLSGIFLGITATLLFPFGALPEWMHRLWQNVPKRDIFEALYKGLKAHGKERRATVLALVAAACSVVPLLSTGWLLSQSLHLDIAPGPMTILFALVLCAISIPLFPGGHGAREAAFVLLFGIFSVTRHGVPVGQETALACSILFLLVVLSWSLIGGVVYLFFSGHLKRTEADM